MTPATGAGTETPDTPGEGSATTEFETARRELLDAVGLEVESRFVDVELGRADGDMSSVRTHVFEAGPADGPTDGDDPPLLFVHGTAAFGAFLAPLLAELDDRRVVGFDRPGYGLSGPFEYRTGSLPGTTVDVVEAVVAESGFERVDLVGHSMGAHVAIAFALAHPDRVRSLSLLGAIPGLPGTKPPIEIRLSVTPVARRVIRRVQKSGEAGVREIAEIFGESDSIEAHPALMRALAAHEADPKAAAARHSEFGSLTTLRGWRPSVRLGADELRAVPHPPTVVWGDHDPLGSPEDGRDAVASITDARFEVLDAGHFPFLGQADRCAELVRETASDWGPRPAPTY